MRFSSHGEAETAKEALKKDISASLNRVPEAVTANLVNEMMMGEIGKALQRASESKKGKKNKVGRQISLDFFPQCLLTLSFVHLAKAKDP